MKFYIVVLKTRRNIFCVAGKPGIEISLDETRQEYQKLVEDDVRRFIQLEVYPKVYGRQMVQELLTAYPAGIENTVDIIGIRPREVAAEICNKNCHAVYFHSVKKRWFFASKLHKEAAEAQLGNP